MRSGRQGAAVEAARVRARRRRGLLAGVALLFAASVPWYRRGGAPLELWLGLPDWAAVAVLCYAGAALLNALAWLQSDIDDAGPLPSGLREPDDAGAGPRGAA